MQDSFEKMLSLIVSYFILWEIERLQKQHYAVYSFFTGHVLSRLYHTMAICICIVLVI